ncbi:hypothetical protein Tco_0681370 [Tanacetum coccineum]|uniref:Uncharacterized protein n=1 Tax=Tanacetum coccineum TaxID=301880 RepID=A0ABQ4XNX7_9ASTR
MWGCGRWGEMSGDVIWGGMRGGWGYFVCRSSGAKLRWGAVVTGARSVWLEGGGWGEEEVAIEKAVWVRVRRDGEDRGGGEGGGKRKVVWGKKEGGVDEGETKGNKGVGKKKWKGVGNEGVGMRGTTEGKSKVRGSSGGGRVEGDGGGERIEGGNELSGKHVRKRKEQGKERKRNRKETRKEEQRVYLREKRINVELGCGVFLYLDFRLCKGRDWTIEAQKIMLARRRTL